MANKSKQFLLPNSSFQKFFESFFEAYEKKLYDIICSPENRSESDKKVKEFDLKYPIPEALKIVQQYLNVEAMSSEPSSSFQLVCNIMHQMAAKSGWSSEKVLPNTHGSNSAALEILAEHRKQKEKLGTTMANSSTSPNNLNHGSTPPHSLEIQDSQAMVYNHSCDYSTISKNMMKSRKKRQNQIVEHIGCGAICNSNIALNINSSTSPNNLNHTSTPHHSIEFQNSQAMDYNCGCNYLTINKFVTKNRKKRQSHIVKHIGCGAICNINIALNITNADRNSKLWPTAKKMQKIAFLFGAFGYMGMVGMLMPPSIMLWFTISAFVFCFLIFTTATFM